jgi:hypothetical protein
MFHFFHSALFLLLSSLFGWGWALEAWASVLEVAAAVAGGWGALSVA